MHPVKDNDLDIHVKAIKKPRQNCGEKTEKIYFSALVNFFGF